MPMTNPEDLYTKIPVEQRIKYAHAGIFIEYLLNDPNDEVRKAAQEYIADN